MSEVYRFPLQLVPSAASVNLPLFQLAAFGAARDGTSGRGRGILIRIVDFDVATDSTNTGDGGRDDDGHAAGGAILPALPLLRVVFGGQLRIMSLRKGFQSGSDMQLLSFSGMNNTANPTLQFWFDTDTGFTKPIRVMGVTLNSETSRISPPISIAELNDVSDLLLLLQNDAGKPLFAVAAGGVLDSLFQKVILLGVPFGRTDLVQTDPLQPVTFPSSPLLRFTFSPPPLLVTPPGIASGAGGVEPTPFQPSRYPSNAATTISSTGLIDIALTSRYPTATTVQPSIAGKAYVQWRTYEADAACYSWLNTPEIGSDPLAPWRAIVLSPTASSATPMYLRWCPVVRQTRAVCHLLCEISIV